MQGLENVGSYKTMLWVWDFSLPTEKKKKKKTTTLEDFKQVRHLIR